MKHIISLFLFTLILISAKAQNPIVPPGMYIADPEAHVWEDGKIYIYGGWNSEMQFNNILMFDLEKLEWTDPDIFNGIPRWNHCSVLVEAIPTVDFASACFAGAGIHVHDGWSFGVARMSLSAFDEGKHDLLDA